jgi:hypothetical protein
MLIQPNSARTSGKAKRIVGASSARSVFARIIEVEVGDESVRGTGKQRKFYELKRDVEGALARGNFSVVEAGSFIDRTNADS